MITSGGNRNPPKQTLALAPEQLDDASTQPARTSHPRTQQCREPCLYLRKTIFDRGQSSGNVVIGTAHRFADLWDTLALQYRNQMLRGRSSAMDSASNMRALRRR